MTHAPMPTVAQRKLRRKWECLWTSWKGYVGKIPAAIRNPLSRAPDDRQEILFEKANAASWSSGSREEEGERVD
jgi:hypothetical protein